jgi:phage gp29-like protein
MQRKGLYINPSTFVEFANATPDRGTDIATRANSLDFYGMSMYLPNPDPVLKKLGKSITVYRELLADPHVGSCVESRQAGVRSMLWEIDRGTSKSRQAKFITDMFDNLNIDQIITEILDGSLYGYQPIEITWANDGAAWSIGAIQGKPPEWFTYDPENHLRFLSRANPMLGQLLPELKFLVARHRASYANPYGDPVLSRCFWPVAFKKGGLKFWAKFTEKFGMPWIVGKHRKGASQEEKTNMLDMLEQMVQDGIAVIPEDASVDTLEAKGGTASVDIYKELLQFCNSEISKAIVGQTLTTEVVGNGSYAASKTMADVRGDIVDSDKRMVESVVNELIGWIVKLNFGDTADCPNFVLYQEGDVDLELSERDKNLTDGGRVKLTKKYYQRAYGLKDDEVEVMDAPAPITPPDTNAPAFSEARTAVASNGSVQDAIDTMTNRLLDQAPTDPLIDPIRKLVDEATSMEDLRDKIIDAYSDLDAVSLGATIEEALTAAELTGRYEVMTETRK